MNNKEINKGLIDTLLIFINRSLVINKAMDVTIEQYENNNIIKILSMVNGLGLLLVLFFYILSIILFYFNINNWFNTTIITGIIGAILLLFFIGIMFLIAFSKNMKRDKYDVLNLFSELFSILVILLPSLASISIIFGIIRTHNNIAITDNTISTIWFIFGLICLFFIIFLLLLSITKDNFSNIKKVLYISSMLIMYILIPMTIIHFFSSLIEWILKLFYKDIEDDNDLGSCNNLDNDKTELFRDKIERYFQINEDCNSEKKYWFIGIILFIFIALITLALNYSLFYMEDSIIYTNKEFLYNKIQELLIKFTNKLRGGSTMPTVSAIGGSKRRKK